MLQDQWPISNFGVQESAALWREVSLFYGDWYGDSQRPCEIARVMRKLDEPVVSRVHSVFFFRFHSKWERFGTGILVTAWSCQAVEGRTIVDELTVIFCLVFPRRILAISKKGEGRQKWWGGKKKTNSSQNEQNEKFDREIDK